VDPCSLPLFQLISDAKLLLEGRWIGVALHLYVRWFEEVPLSVFVRATSSSLSVSHSIPPSASLTCTCTQPSYMKDAELQITGAPQAVSIRLAHIIDIDLPDMLGDGEQTVVLFLRDFRVAHITVPTRDVALVLFEALVRHLPRPYTEVCVCACGACQRVSVRVCVCVCVCVCVLTPTLIFAAEQTTDSKPHAARACPAPLCA
jgi:hypothetical protein